MPKNPFKTKQALEIQRLLQELVTTKAARKHDWCYNREK